ncbi:type IVB secretion system protein IcmH/DotU [Ameyamaea chiangmaiensis]|uniref:DotU family type IV/VI secretion system protein n=1 Tax=Ameyamaea chiangmaiensis TaxID=442969 RepID=A0A850PFC7_9PROT|nr:type IVB secretion system protein IcmH/DotU [Ameyamaea chiangmaiensis]MBS4076102.1 type IVB secretion system protein IcmH/DotU [Ameyamaea chiangmaiensis]NVN40612.1 DotU family type IV/VI secretion system protein [Ameyamaea chiangmaiensis]
MTIQGNPFAEPDDDDRTVIMSREATLSALAGRQQLMQVEASEEDDLDFAALPHSGGNVAVTLAGSLLTLMARLRNAVSVPDAGALRDRTGREVERYGAALREAGLPSEVIRLAHYAICASLDDVVQGTPWGSHGPWADLSLTSEYHRDVKGGERFFVILGKLRESPTTYVDVLELMYMCMSLGMQGQYRLMPRGPAELEREREETYAAIVRVRGPAPADLSPSWAGVAEPFRALRFEMPIWLAALLGAGILGVAYALVLFAIGAASDSLLAGAFDLPPHAMPAIGRPALVTAAPAVPHRDMLRARLEAALEADIHAGNLTVAGTELVPIIRLQARGMFDTGAATVLPQFVGVLRRVGDAIGRNDRRTNVIGYTDSQPIRTVAYPSNYALSLARAQAAAAVIMPYVGDGQVTASGQGAQSPVGDNATEAGRSANRRVEIVVQETAAQ